MILSLPFGIRDEKGYLREKPLSEELLNKGYKGLVLLENVDSADASVVSRLISENHIVPRIRQTEGDPTWAVRIRKHKDKLVMHVLNRALKQSRIRH